MLLEHGGILPQGVRFGRIRHQDWTPSATMYIDSRDKLWL